MSSYKDYYNRSKICNKFCHQRHQTLMLFGYTHFVLLLLLLLLTTQQLQTTNGFIFTIKTMTRTTTTTITTSKKAKTTLQQRMPMVVVLSSSSSSDEIIGDGGLDSGGVMIDDLMWRVEKLRLEERNKQQFLKARARFLPYEECRKWVQAWGQRWRNAQEWNDWIAMGEKRNPYIPSKPDEYYGRLGEWISWDHFLLQSPGDDNDDEKVENNE